VLGSPVMLSPDQILQRLAALFLAPAHDRHVYTVFGDYRRLRPFQKRLREEAERGNFNSPLGNIEYLSLNRELLSHMDAKGLRNKAQTLATGRRDDELRRLLSESFRDLVTSRIERSETLGLVLADFELLYAYDLGHNDISIVRQVAINGKRVCLLVPGALQDGRLWVFDEDPESRREFPEPLLFMNSGWVFTFAPTTSGGGR
jgi:hypothetical protein